jgi:cation:H+ antiporter
MSAEAPCAARMGARLRRVLDLFLVVIGIAGLAYGGDLLVDNASRLARGFGISPLVIGLTVVAFGTSAPELAASLAAALRGSPEIALANVIGSNIANVGLILGASALMWPLTTTWSFVRREVAVMIVASLVAMLLLLDGGLGRIEAGVLLLGLVAFLVIAFRGDGGAASGETRDDRTPASPRLRPALLALAGVGLLAVAAQALVTGAISLAQAWGVSERVIGLTMVAVGTSLPELASSIAAALRRQGDIILGNIVGSNLFNLLSVLALAGLVHPLQTDASALRLDLFVMLAFAAVVAPIAVTGWRVGRREGAALLVAYLVYVVLVLM